MRTKQIKDFYDFYEASQAGCHELNWHELTSSRDSTDSHGTIFMHWWRSCKNISSKQKSRLAIRQHQVSTNMLRSKIIKERRKPTWPQQDKEKSDQTAKCIKMPTPSLHQHFLQNPPVFVASATEVRILPLLPARGRPSRFGEGALFVSSRGATRRWTREKSGHRRHAAAATPALLSDSWQRMDT